MTEPLVSDELWALLEPLLPGQPPKPKGGRPRLSDRAAFSGILFVLKSGIPWEMLPPGMGCGSGMTCWRRLRDWQQAGVWAELHTVVLDKLAQANQLDWSRASIDSASVAAPHAPKGAVKGPSGSPKKSARTRRTGANRAPSVTSS